MTTIVYTESQSFGEFLSWESHMKKYRSIWIMGVVTLVFTSLLAWLVVEGKSLSSTPAQDLAFGFVGMATMAAIYGGFLQRFHEELKELRFFRAYADTTFPHEIQRECVMRKLTSLADIADLASLRVIKLQRGGLREMGLVTDEDNSRVERDFDTVYHNANGDFRAAQAVFYAYFELVKPFAPELNLELGERNFKRFTSTASPWEGF
jgi:hypothetical protein